MTLLFFWHPPATGTPTPPEPEVEAPAPGDIGAAPYPWRPRRVTVHEDDEEIMDMIAAFITQRRH